MADSTDDRLRSYFQQGDIWEAEIIKRAKRSSRIAWFFALAFAGIAALSLLAIVLMLPLKSFEPYLVEVDRNTGSIEVKSGLTRPTNLTEQEAVTQANVVRLYAAGRATILTRSRKISGSQHFCRQGMLRASCRRFTAPPTRRIQPRSMAS